jgi:hypothetical protein
MRPSYKENTYDSFNSKPTSIQILNILSLNDKIFKRTIWTFSASIGAHLPPSII